MTPRGASVDEDAARCLTVADRATTQLDVWTTWLRDHRVRGVVGEVGWPSTPDGTWEREVAARWLDSARAGGVGVYVWSAAEQWDPGYPLAVYRTSPDGLVVAGSQAPLVEGLEARGQGASALRGVALAAPSFGASFEPDSTYSSTNAGVRGRDYLYPSTAFLSELAARGLTSVRLAVMWERLQPRLDGPLDPQEVAEVTRVVRTADSLGMTVVVDLHNYGRYAEGTADGGRRVLRVGGGELPAAALADVWRRLAAALRGSPALAAYGLMNEPHDLPGGARGWEATTRAAVAAVREVDPTTLILVPGYAWSGVDVWTRTHPQPWVDDPKVAYEAHQYFDEDHSGRYTRSYAAEAAAVRC